MPKPFYVLVKSLPFDKIFTFSGLNLYFSKKLIYFLAKPYLLTFIFKMCYSQPHLPTYPPINLPTYLPLHLLIYLPTHPFTYLFTLALASYLLTLLYKYILNPTYMARPNYLVNTPTNLAIIKNDKEKKN